MKNNKTKNTKIIKAETTNRKQFWKLTENKNPISWFYFCVGLAQIILVTLIATMTFLVHPFWWNATLYNRPDLISAFVFEGFVFFIGIFQIWYLYKNKRITYLQIIYIVLSLFVILLNALAIVLIPLMLGLLIKQKVKKKIMLKLTVFGILSIFIFPVTAISTLVLWGIATSQDKDDTKSYTIAANKAPKSNVIPKNQELNIMTWNIGYGATPSDQGYFYDVNYKGESGPVGKAHNKNKTLHHLKGIEQFFKASTTGGKLTGAIDVYNASKDDAVIEEFTLPKVDFGFVQEVDRDAIRSFRTNQPQRISDVIGNYDAEFVNNFKVGQLPVPLMDPGGAVDAGLLTFSNYKIDKSKARRISLNSVGSGLDGIFNLKRAIGYTEYKVDGGNKKLHMANIHLSAFPNDKAKRVKEYNVLAKLIEKWSKNGDYIIIGGDWNTDITDSYYYEKAGSKTFNGRKESQKLRDENIFGLKGKTGNSSVVKPLGIYDISKIPEEFRKVITKFKLKIGVDYNLDNPTMHSNPEKFIGIRRDGDYVPSVAIIDGFMTSSNVKINKTKTYQQGWNKNTWNEEQPYLFSDSDHNPVIMSFELQ